MAKARRILLKGVQDNIVSSLHGKVTPYAMWNALTKFLQNRSDHKKLTPKDKLKNITMEEGKMIPKYLMNFTQCRDELGSVGVIASQDDLVSLDILGLPKSWNIYQDSVNGRKKLPDWERLWSNLAQE